MASSQRGPFSRRGVLSVGLAMPFIGTAFAQTTTDLAVSCDAAAGPAVIAAARAYRQASGVRVRVFPTASGLILPQIEREIQNDIIVTQPGIIDQAEKEGLVVPGGRAGPWRNRLVIATAVAGTAGVFAVPDPSPASDIDGIAILNRLGTTTGKVLGMIDTGAVAWAMTTGAARQGILHQTEVTADNRLQTVLPVPDEAWPPILYAATVTKLARRGDPAAFIAFLASPDGKMVLRSAGLEVAL